MNRGAIITKGPQAWQVIQQVGGKADLKLEGIYNVEAHDPQSRVWVRVVREDTSEQVIRWQQSEAVGNGKWAITLEEVPAGGLYRIETCLKESDWQAMEWCTRGDMIHHVGVGDLYVIAGQSNSAGYGKGPVCDPPELGIHLLRNNGRWDLATHPFNESTDTIHPVNQEGANPGHSPYLAFAKRLRRDIGYPIGLIQTALGGSPLSAWNPEEDGCLYRNMIEVIQSMTTHVTGVLWYQGCSDTEPLKQAYSYLDRFKTMVTAMRSDLGQPELPIFTIQLNRVINHMGDLMAKATSDEGWSVVREAQRQAARQIPGVWILPSIDGGLSDAIHNASTANVMMGERLARLVLEGIYGKQVDGQAADLQSICQKDETTLELVFAPVYERLDALDVAPEDLAILVEDHHGIAPLVQYEVCGDQMILHTARPIVGEARVSCGIGRYPKGYVPMDRATQLPVVLWYNERVKSKS
ncbi:MAG: sialate O-acetylesterase [Cellulosilyticaceae bacterium]